MPAWGWALTETFVWLSFSANRRSHCSSRFGWKPAHDPPAPPIPRPSSPLCYCRGCCFKRPDQEAHAHKKKFNSRCSYVRRTGRRRSRHLSLPDLATSENIKCKTAPAVHFCFHGFRLLACTERRTAYLAGIGERSRCASMRPPADEIEPKGRLAEGRAKNARI
jgi:hypothetical protein